MVTKFGKDAQTNLETLYGTMVNYTMKDLAGDESMMRFAGWSDSQIKKAKGMDAKLNWREAAQENEKALRPEEGRPDRTKHDLVTFVETQSSPVRGSGRKNFYIAYISNGSMERTGWPTSVR